MERVRRAFDFLEHTDVTGDLFGERLEYLEEYLKLLHPRLVSEAFSCADVSI